MAKKLALIVFVVAIAVSFFSVKTVLAATKTGDACTVTAASSDSCGSGFVCSNLRVPPGIEGQNGTLAGECQPSGSAGAGSLAGTSSQTSSGGSCTFFTFFENPFGCLGQWIFALIANIIAFILNLIVGLIAAIGFAIAAWFLQWAISVNQTLVHPVGGGISFAQYGFSLTLQFANIIIIIAMVVIAFGTMFRQSFGSKNLPKLIFVALIINFSYFLASIAINITDGMMGGFLTAAGLSNGVWGNLTNFANGIGNSFQQGATALSGQSASTSFFVLISPLFNLLFDTFAIIILIGIGVMFFIRYVALTILLILLPLALSFSLLPIKVGKGDIWSRWSQEFTRWLIFGPAMMFFVWLAFSLDLFTQKNSVLPSASSSAVTSNLPSAFMAYIASLGMLLGGAIVANEIGVAGAKQLNNAIQQTGKWFQTTAKDLGTRPLRTERGQKFTARLQSTRIPVVAQLGQGLNKLGAVGEKTVSMDKYKDMSSKRLAQMIPSMTPQDRMIALSQLAKKGDLGDVENIWQYLTDDNKKLFGLYGQNFSGIEKGSGMNIAMAKAMREYQTNSSAAQRRAREVLSGTISSYEDRIDRATDKKEADRLRKELSDIIRRRVGEDPDFQAQTQKFQRDMQTAAAQFYKGFSKKDWGKFPADAFMSAKFLDDAAKPYVRQAIAGGVIEANRSDFKRLLNVKGENMKSAADAIRAATEEHVRAITELGSSTRETKEAAEKFKETVDNSLKRVTAGSMEEREERPEGESTS